jgi:hypothetical protein
MVSEEHPLEASAPRPVRAIFPLRLGVGFSADGVVYPTTAPIDAVRLERVGVTDRSLVIDGDGVYLCHGDRVRALHRWTDEVE